MALILISGMLVAVWSLAIHGLTLLACCWVAFGWGLVALAVIDARTKLLPDILTLPLMWFGIMMQLFPETRTVGLEASVWGVLAGYVPLWLLAHAYRLVRGRDGLGFGDLKLLAAMGAWSGAAILPGVVFLSALMALIGMLAVRLWHRVAAYPDAEFPYGPWIIAAYMISLVVGFNMFGI